MTKINTIKENDWVLLRLEDESTYLVQVKKGTSFSTHKGAVPLSDLIGSSYREIVIDSTGARVFVTEPTIEDHMMKVKRHTNITYPKEAALMLMKGNVRIGSRVLEVGTGSGSMTMALADKVGDEGRVYTYERREEFIELAKENIAKTGLSDRIEFFLREEGTSFFQEGVDCTIMDIPTPWEEVEFVKRAMRPGGRLISMNPTYNQIEQMAEAMRQHGFVAIESLELLMRRILPRLGRTRPVQQMVTHTEFLLYGIRLGD